jgi:hypothetical protein
MGEYEKQRDEFRVRERELLLQAVPEWQDPKKAEQGKQKLYQYAQSFGFTDAELGTIEDHRLMVLLRKAMLYDRAANKGKKAVAQAKSKGVPVLKPGTSRPPKAKRGKRAQRERMSRLEKTGRLDDAASVVFHMLGE